MQNSDNNTIEINTGGFLYSVENNTSKIDQDEVSGNKTKRKNCNELSKLKKSKVLSSSTMLYNKKQKICNEIKDVINPNFKIDNMLYKKTKTLKGISNLIS